MEPETSPVIIDPGDFDAVGVMADVIVAVRLHAMEHQVDVIATVSAPTGRHALSINARPSGHGVLGVRYADLTRSRRNVVADALARLGWDADEDAGGATRRYPPGTDHTTMAFEALAALSAGGSTADLRTVTAVDAVGDPVRLA